MILSSATGHALSTGRAPGLGTIGSNVAVVVPRPAPVELHWC